MTLLTREEKRDPAILKRYEELISSGKKPQKAVKIVREEFGRTGNR